VASIRLQGVRKQFPGGHIAVDRMDLTIEDGELFVLVGPSGCGKSTVLRLLAGLDAPDDGRIFIGDREVTGDRPQDRDVAMVFQDYALYPHKTVRENLAFGLRMRGAAQGHILAKVQEVAALLDIGELLDRRPRQLSGGQRQRVALGRAIARDPRAFLLDEPLSNLDAKLRVQTRTELASLQRRLGTTMVYVTHDQEEAMTLGDRVAVMRQGRIEQVAPPLEVYGRPASSFVGTFVGSPEMNLLPVEARADGALAGAGFALTGELPAQVAAGRRVVVGVRPSDVAVVPADQGDMTGRVDVVEPLGPALLCHIMIGTQRLRVLTAPEAPIKEGDEVSLQLRRDRLHLFDPDGARLG
jgi:multiple sugar transport system ATP-binding protein